MDVVPGIEDILFEEVLIYGWLLLLSRWILEEDLSHLLLVHGGMVLDVRVDDKGGELAILGVLDLVFEDTEDVETRQDSIGKVHIVHE